MFFWFYYMLIIVNGKKINDLGIVIEEKINKRLIYEKKLVIVIIIFIFNILR